MIPRVDAIPPIKGRVGPPKVMRDRGYNADWHRMKVSGRGIVTPKIARRATEHGSGLGTSREVVEQTIALLHQSERLRVSYDKRPDIHEAFLKIGCVMIRRRRPHTSQGYF